MGAGAGGGEVIKGGAPGGDPPTEASPDEAAGVGTASPAAGGPGLARAAAVTSQGPSPPRSRAPTAAAPRGSDPCAVLGRWGKGGRIWDGPNLEKSPLSVPPASMGCCGEGGADEPRNPVLALLPALGEQAALPLAPACPSLNGVLERSLLWLGKEGHLQPAHAQASMQGAPPPRA
jgi:hypothetical protein